MTKKLSDDNDNQKTTINFGNPTEANFQLIFFKEKTNISEDLLSTDLVHYIRKMSTNWG